MIISNDKKFIFIHIHKTGGSSIDFSLLKYFDYADVLEQELASRGMELENFSTVKSRIFRQTGIDLTKQYFRGNIVGGKLQGLCTDCLTFIQMTQIDPKIKIKIKKYFCFSFVRNPYDRIYSAYQMSCRNREEENGFPRLFNEEIMFRSIIDPMYSYLPSLKYMDFIGRTETLEQHFGLICKKLDLETDLKNINVWSNIESKYRYLDNYTPLSIARVNHLHKKDFKMFGYPMLSPDNYMNHIDDVLDLPPIEK